MTDACTGAPTFQTASVTLIVSTAATGDNPFPLHDALPISGTYGSFTFNSATGAWGYTLNNGATNVQALTATSVVHDTLTVKSVDGTATQVIDVTINGTNDAATISSTAAGTVTEDGDGATTCQTASGTLSVSDVDSGENHFQAVAAAALTGTYGSFTFNSATGAWGYTLNN